ncbi:MAG: ankyrin repeat domain-containing protein [Bacteroidota bacterium]
MNKTILLLLFMTLAGSAFAQNMFRTACQGNLARLDSLLEDTSVNTQDFRGRSLLHWAVACRQKEVFDYLVEKGIDINLEDHDQETPLHMAVRFDNEEYFNQLVDLQPNQDWIEAYGPSLMQKAVLKESQAFIKLLLAHGVDIDARNDRGSTPLEIASRIGATAIADSLLHLGANPDKVRTIEVFGDYMGPERPEETPLIFAPNFISTEEYEFGSVFSADGKEFFYGVDVNGKAETRYSKLEGERWSEPVIILSHERYGYNDPFLSPDENRLYVISPMAMDGVGEPKDYDIWYIERTEEGWSEPINAGPNINSAGNEYYISFTKDGTMYFSSNANAPEGEEGNYDIYYSKYKNGEFQEPIVLGDAINASGYDADVFIDPDESYIIFCSTREEGLGRGDLYISFKNEDGSWTDAVNMGAPTNTVHHELCPFVTKDGQYFFYTSDQDIYWVSTTIFDELRDQSKE